MLELAPTDISEAIHSSDCRGEAAEKLAHMRKIAFNEACDLIDQWPEIFLDED